MTKNYFEEYKDFIDGLQYRIMQIQLRYNDCQHAISTAQKKGFIVKEVAEKMLAVKINQFVPSMDRMYRLSKDDIDFINKYAALDGQGNVLASILKPEYLRKAETLDYILKSVKVFHYYEVMDDKTKRLRLKNELISAFSKKISELRGKLAQIVKNKGQNAEQTDVYKQTELEIGKLSGAIESFEEIEQYDDEKIIRLISSFYHVDYSYFEWYKNMELKSLKESDVLYKEQTSVMKRASIYSRDLMEGQRKTSELLTVLNNINATLISFIESMVEFDLEEFEKEETKDLSFFQKVKLQGNNKELLRKLFTVVVTFPGVFEYLEKSFYKDNNEIDVNECFNKYFEANYSLDTSSVNLSRFLLTLKKSVIEFYKGKIESAKIDLAGQMKVNNGIGLTLSDSIKTGKEQAELHERAYNVTNLDKSLLSIEGFDDEELEKMFLSLRRILNSTTTYGSPLDEMRRSK